MTTHDSQVERYREEYTEPANRPKEGERISLVELVRKVIELRNSITREQLAQIEQVLAGSKAPVEGK